MRCNYKDYSMRIYRRYIIFYFIIFFCLGAIFFSVDMPESSSLRTHKDIQAHTQQQHSQNHKFDKKSTAPVRDISKIKIFEDEEEEEEEIFVKPKSGKTAKKADTVLEKRIKLRQRLLNKYLLTVMNDSLLTDPKYRGRRMIGSQYMRDLIKKYDDNPN